jgi:excisionase family DNA binding protein
MTLLTTRQVAQRLGVGARQIQRYIQSKRLKAARVGDMFFIAEKDLAALKIQSPGRPRKPSKEEKRNQL